MRLDQPRLAPLSDDRIDEELRKRFMPGRTLNIFGTLAHHPKLLRDWLRFGTHVLADNTLPAREREIVILRVGWLSRAGYEWGQHVVIGKASGLDDDDIARIGEGPEAAGWNDLERALLRATDELHADAFISDATWRELEPLSDEQRIDLIFTVGQYMLVSMALNSLGVQLDPGVEGLPPERDRA